MNALELQGLTKHYKDFTLGPLDLTLPGGTICGLIGENGAGKSTLINLITDNVKRETGEILCDGEDILKLGAAYRKRIGYMPQQQNMYNGYSAIAFLKYIAAIKGIPSKEASIEIENLLKTVNLWDVRHRRIETYSGGMKQRVLLAQALLGNRQRALTRMRELISEITYLHFQTIRSYCMQHMLSVI